MRAARRIKIHRVWLCVCVCVYVCVVFAEILVKDTGNQCSDDWVTK